MIRTPFIALSEATSLARFLTGLDTVLSNVRRSPFEHVGGGGGLP
jgi:hypothetical protein